MSPEDLTPIHYGKGHNRRKEDTHVVLQPARRLYVGVLFVLLAFIVAGQGYLTSTVFTQAQRQRTDEHVSCLIQARSLPANRHLAVAMNDIYQLLTYPQPHPEKVSPGLKKIVSDLDSNLHTYYEIQSKQPSHRSCNR